MINEVWPEPIISELTIKFVQDCDCMDSDERGLGYQEFKVKWEDGGGGLFPIIETERFAFDNIGNEMGELLGSIQNLILEWNKNHEKKIKPTVRSTKTATEQEAENWDASING